MPDPSRLFAALERERQEREQEDQHYSRSRGEHIHCIHGAEVAAARATVEAAAPTAAATGGQLHEAEVAAATATVEAAVETQAPVAVAAAAPAV